MHRPLRTSALRAALLAGALAMTGAAIPAPAPLTGEWGGLQTRLRLGDAGGTIDFDCAAATIDSAVHPDARGRFTATGRYQAFLPGPDRDADTPPVFKRARFNGQVEAATMKLSMRLDDSTASQDLTLVRGRRVKLIRCL
jgi:hypothetical protein